MNSFIKSDVKAQFMAENKKRIKTDLPDYYRISGEFARERGMFKETFFMLDMSSIYERQWYYDIFTQELNINICDNYVSPENQRDALFINLYEKTPYYLQRLRVPIIYFVDEMVSLRSNRLWLELRANRQDLVIDRNANIELLCEVIEDVC